MASKAVAELLPHSKTALLTPCSLPAWQDSFYKDCCAYVRCLDDAALPVSVQDSMLQESGTKWSVHTLNSGHSPFLSCPDDLAKCLMSVAVDFAREILSQIWMQLPVEP